MSSSEFLQIWQNNLSQTKYDWVFFIFLVPSIVFHEVAHGWVADFFGDHTARERKRLSLNPIRHIDPVGSLLLPAIMVLLLHYPAFGYAKPVPVNPRRLRKPRSQMLYVALAGPITNIILSAIAFGVCDYAISAQNQNLLTFGVAFGLGNICLAAFNLLPIPPLDGSAIVERFIPNRHLARYYYLRARFLPFFIIFILVDYEFLHVGTNWLSDLETWWLNRLS